MTLDEIEIRKWQEQIRHSSDAELRNFVAILLDQLKKQENALLQYKDNFRMLTRALEKKGIVKITWVKGEQK